MGRVRHHDAKLQAQREISYFTRLIRKHPNSIVYYDDGESIDSDATFANFGEILYREPESVAKKNLGDFFESPEAAEYFLRNNAFDLIGLCYDIIGA